MSKSSRAWAVAKAKHRKTKRKGNLAEFFAASPLRGSRIRIWRSKDRAPESKQIEERFANSNRL